MASKRQFRDREDDIPGRESKRGLTFANIGGNLLKGCPTNELLAKLESFIQNVVQDEVPRSVERFLHQFSSPSLDQIESSQARTWELHFVDKVPQTIFTGNKVESADGELIKIVIRDAVSKNIITSGPLSSVKIEILVLDGNFGSDDQEDWNENKFKANIVRKREGKKPLLVGKLRITLKDGVGDVSGVVFTDNSSWIKGRKFRLGARIVQGNSNGLRIREARSEAFVVKDRRGESYEKHHPPTMEDEVWRLKKIAKDGVFHKRLANKGITTVKEFTRIYHVDSKHLRDVLDAGISNRTWQIITEHATKCVVDEKLYIYSTDTTKALVFDSVFKLVGVFFNGQNYQSLDNLSDFQMGFVKSLKEQAYKNVSAWVPLDDMSSFGPAMPSSSLRPEPYSSPIYGLEQVFPSIQQDQFEMQSVSHYPTQPSYATDVQDTDSMKESYLVNPYTDDKSQIGHLITENVFPFCQSPWEVNNPLSGFSSGTLGIVAPDFSIFSRSATPRARWRMIKAAFTWSISLKRDIAAKKKRAKSFYTAFVGQS